MDHCIVCNKETTYDYFYKFTNVCCDCVEKDDVEDNEKEDEWKNSK